MGDQQADIAGQKVKWPEPNVSGGKYDRHETYHSLDLVQVDPLAQHSPDLHMDTNHLSLKHSVFIHPCSAGLGMDLSTTACVMQVHAKQHCQARMLWLTIKAMKRCMNA